MDLESEKIIDRILDLWEKEFTDKKVATNEEIPKLPIIYDLSKIKECILFIGINPSDSDKKFGEISKGTIFVDRNKLNWKNKKIAKKNTDEILKMEKQAYEIYDYYKKSQKIAKDIGLLWGHIDLFFYRGKNQKLLKEKIYFNEDLNDFGREQLEIAIDMIDLIKPKVIVVANAEASKILKNKFSLNENNLDEDKGIHFYKGRIPIFFSSIFSGGRLDNGSFERLKWHIKMIVNNRFK